MTVAAGMVSLLLLTACSQQHTAPKPSAALHLSAAPKSASLQLDFIPSGWQAPFALAGRKGFYRSRGLDLRVIAGKGSGLTVQQVANGAATFGFANFGNGVSLIAKGAPMESVMVIDQQNPFCIISRASAHITKPSDLEHRTLAFHPGGIVNFLLPMFLKATHVPAASIHMIHVAPSAVIPAFASGRANALAAVVYFSPPILEQMGFKLNELCLSQYGVNPLGDAIWAKRSTVREDPAMVRAFVAGTIQGFKYAAAHPRQAVAALIEQFPSAHLKAPVAQGQLENYLKLLHTQATRGRSIGWVAPSDVAATIEILKRYGNLKTNLSPSDFYTNAFVPNK